MESKAWQANNLPQRTPGVVPLVRRFGRIELLMLARAPLEERRLEHYLYQRLKAKGQMLARMDERRKKGERLHRGGCATDAASAGWVRLAA
jgi:hypothetical protein